MTSKLKLDAEALEITSFDTVEMAVTGGAVLDAGGVMPAFGTRTRLTGPCCEETRLC
jgi:hypothetical protein